METIEVQCDDNCIASLGSANTFSVRLNIYNTASNSGIRQSLYHINNPFEVVFRSSGVIVGREIWKYNNFSGAWRSGDQGNQHVSY